MSEENKQVEKSLVEINISKIEEIGLPTTDAEKIVASFSEVAEIMTDLDKELLEFNKNKPEEITKAVCNKAKELRLKHVKARTLGDKIHKNLKSDVLLRTRAIDGVRNVYKLKLSEREEKLMDIEKHFEKIEQEKQDKIYQARVDELSKYVEDTSVYNLREMSNEGYQEILNNSKAIHEQKLNEQKEAEEKAEAEAKKEQLHNDRKNELLDLWQFLEDKEQRFDELSEEDFGKLKKDLEAKKVDFDKKQKELENERKKAEADAEKERKEKQKLQDEIDRKNKEEADRKEKEAEEERKAKEEADRKAQEEAEAKKQAELAPDKEKLINYANELSNVPLPALKSEEANAVLKEAQELLAKVTITLKVK